MSLFETNSVYTAMVSFDIIKGFGFSGTSACLIPKGIKVDIIANPNNLFDISHYIQNNFEISKEYTLQKFFNSSNNYIDKNVFYEGYYLGRIVNIDNVDTNDICENMKWFFDNWQKYKSTCGNESCELYIIINTNECIKL